MPNKPLLPFILFFVGMYYLMGRNRTRGQMAACALLAAAALPLLDGAFLLVREVGRFEDGRVSPGVVLGRLSTTGEDGTRTIGGPRYTRVRRRSLPWLKTIDGFRYHDVLARVLLTGSKHAWVVEYRYPCAEVSGGCFQRDFVSHALWSRLREGQMVNVRTAKGLWDSGRLDENPMWGTAFAMLGPGGALVLAAAFASGRWTFRRRRFVTAPAVVTSVDPVEVGGKVQWRVGYAYFAADGTAHQRADEVYVPGLKPGDDCTAVYPADSPDLGTLHLAPRAAR